MFHWISGYNYDFALAAIPIQILILLFYCSRRNLPLRSSASFLYVMIANLVMTASDIISCEMNEIWTQYPLWLMYVVNFGYFVAFILRGWALFDYTAEECNAYRTMGRWSRPLTWMPAALVVILILSSPWTSAIFHFAPGVGYYNCSLYKSIYYSTYFYIAVSILSVIVTWRQTQRRLKLSMLGYNAVLIAGIFLRKLFINTLVTSYFSIIAILVVYLSAQNPDLYRERKTRLFNKDAFDRIAAELLRENKRFRCIIASIHNYESAKVLYGHQQMNRSLELIGRWLWESFPREYVFYFGNGDYLLLGKDHKASGREGIIRKINDRFSLPWQAKDTDVALSVSAIALPWELLPKEIAEVDDLISYAYSRAYIENERGNIAITQNVKTELIRRKAVEHALGRALKEHRIEAYFQPIFSVKEQKIIGAEALARLRDPDLGFIPPDEFIHVAEQTGDIMELGRQMFERVCIFLASPQAKASDIRRINVNLSPAQCLNDQLASELFAIARRYQVSMSLIDFEITESTITDTMMLLKQMLMLQEQEATFSLDDFGTGTSNLTRLMKLPIQTVKLDMNVVHSYFTGESGVLPDLVNMFQNAKMEVVVEGVETEEMKNVLSEMGCDYLQGYYFSKPVPPPEFLDFIHKFN